MKVKVKKKESQKKREKVNLQNLRNKRKLRLLQQLRRRLKRANTDEATEVTIGGSQQPKKPRILNLHEEIDEERKYLDDIGQFQVVSQKPLSDIDTFCENLKTNIDLSRF